MLVWNARVLTKGKIAWSVWDPEASASAAKLHLKREATRRVRRFSIVGFNPPAEETVHPQELCRRFCQAAAREFWPVLAGDHPELEVTSDLMNVETGDVELTAKAEITEEVKPFVTCLRAFRDNTVVEAITKEDDVAVATIPLKIPAQISGAPAVDSKVTLCVRLAPTVKGLVNNVAYARGFGMVVKVPKSRGYLPLRPALRCNASVRDAAREQQRGPGSRSVLTHGRTS